ncbi:hypothetical protein DICPUDRAFT_94710 [Dictyostelium purpureum]|uniref:Transmembrane 9 superfamily member n=1 Tax=Dictyostelium purpureum TaxID=5786 RepID=F0ZMP2_DICPU|nr:uncharacterized protein DICPUDRAFT_94710 [Dictyostelium purpureum]EGC34778.1 hypothetical protein DICPUDRAFT_94710 [Dictyostelium purpureum]|eukprot:XP_003288693.1 hypothetical protein DICPUDRAFT_94710 [Dictyostelium purpureum]
MITSKKILFLFLILFFINGVVVDSRIVSKKQPTVYVTKDKIPIYMNSYRLDLSIYDYYKLPFLKPEGDITYKQSFFEKLSGDLKSSSIYQIEFNLKKNYEVGSANFTKDNIKELKKLIDKEYRIHFFVDDLPIGEYFVDNSLVTGSENLSSSESSANETTINYDNTEKNHILLGYPIGFKVDDRYFINNYLSFRINISKVSDLKDEMEAKSGSKEAYTEYIIQSVYIEPYSVNKTDAFELDEDKVDSYSGILKTPFSYAVHFNTVKGRVDQRWSLYYVESPSDTPISILSVVVVLAFSSIIVLIFLNIFRAKTYQTLGFEDGGWKSIYADVFRSPHNFMTFSIIVGFGAQIAVTIFILMVFSVAGLLSIANPGGLATASMVVFAFSALFNGYSSMRVYIMLGGTRKLYNSVVTITLIPLIVLVLIFIGYFQIWGNGFVYAPTAGSVFFVLAMWILVSMPCSLISSYFVKTWPPPGYPVRTNPIPRFIPQQKWYQNPYLHMLLGGAITFSIIYTELYYFLTSFVLGEHYEYSTSFSITFISMVVLILELNMILEYYQLSIENYNWWWRSLVRPATTGLYTFIYCIYFGASNIGSSGAGFYYFIFSLVFSILMSLFCSSIGFIGNLWFMKKIYSTLHFD